MSRVDELSPHALARFAGALYLVNIVLGAFAIGFAPSQPALHRLGAAAHMVVDLTNIPLGLIFYELFRVVSRRLAVLVVLFTLVATSIEMAYVADHLAAQSNSTAGYDVSTGFFAFCGLTVGWLVYRSTFLPRILGILLIAGALCYLGFGFADILTPRFASLLVPWIQLPSLLGELSFTLWLPIAGVDAERWVVLRDQVDPHAGQA